MSKISILDCTLRDGGYINDWNFGFHTIRDIIRDMVDSKVNYAEVGFLRDCEYSKDKALFNNCEEIMQVLPPLDMRGNTIFTAMALHNKYDVSKLEEYDGSSIEAVRVTFHDYDIDEGLCFIQEVQAKGYKVFCNPINIMGYTDEQILELIKKVNVIRPFGFSIVDTFGSMMKSDLRRIYSLLEHNLDKSVVIGLHLHENLGLAYSLAQDFIDMKSPERECIIDGSMMGMGRIPGNLCIELIMEYLNRNCGATYDINPVLDGIDDHIMKIREKKPWGYSTAYALSAKYNLHRNYAEYLLNKGRLRAKQINQILASIDDEKKTVFDEEYIESLYSIYQNRQVDDSILRSKLSCELKDKEIVILAPGTSIVDKRNEISSYIEQNRALVISSNFIPSDYDVDYVFFSNPMRYGNAKNEWAEWSINAIPYQVLVTSNISEGINSEENILNFADLSVSEAGKSDNSVILLLRLMMKLGMKHVSLAGFDGYRLEKGNYVSTYYDSQHTKRLEENGRNKALLFEIKKNLEITFLTDSLYVE